VIGHYSVRFSADAPKMLILVPDLTIWHSIHWFRNATVCA